MAMLYPLILMTPGLKRSWQEITGRISMSTFFRPGQTKNKKTKKKRKEGVRGGGMEGMGSRKEQCTEVK